MRCKTCDYALWDIKDRKCPECGTPFTPSEYEFALNSVQFCCPHCEQDYYGTGPRGELVPRMFACVRCGRTVDMDEMILRPTAGVKEEQTEGPRQPWLEWGTRRGFWSAFFATIGHALVMPGRLMKATPVEGGVAKSMGFMVLVQLMIGLVYGGMMLLFVGIMGMAISGMSGGTPSPGISVTGPMFIAGISVAGFFLFVYAVEFFGTLLVAHGLLKLTGGCAHGIGRTWQALCYSSGANIVSCVPCLGGYFGWIWWLVSACIAVKESQRVHGGRAALAVLAFPLGSIAAFITLYVVFIVSAIGTASSASVGGGPASLGQTRMVTIAGAFRSASRPVRHAIELIAAGSMSEYDVMDVSDMSSGGFMGRMKSAPVGGTTLEAFQTLPTQQQNKHVQIELDGMDPNIIAYRLGDTVFTHCGIDVSAASGGAGGLWVAIDWPENLNPTSQPARTVHMACVDGSVRSCTANAMDIMLKQQNQVRSLYGLEPLPDPGEVTHHKPALGTRPPALKQPGSSAPKDDAPGA